MPPKRPAEVVYSFPYAERHPHDVISAVQIETLAEDRPGLYAWYLRLLPRALEEGNVSIYARFFGSKQMQASLKAYLGELYEGPLGLVPVYDAARPAHLPLLANAATVFSPPIYIGIATKVRTRLITHRRQLEDALAGTVIPIPSDLESDPDKLLLDTDEESSFFGGRVGALLRPLGVNDVSSFFLKIVYQPTDNPDERRAVEHFVNRVFFPFCGRR